MEISPNFAFLSKDFPQIAESATFAELHALGDPRAALFHARHAVEQLIKSICFETPEDSTRAVLFAHKPLNEMDSKENVRACYLHAALRSVERDPMTSSSLRERFGIEKKNMAIASRIIKDTLEENLIKPFDVDQGRKHANISFRA